MTNKVIIGWSEYVSFPDWGIEGIKAKIDTGARSSALHVEDLHREKDGWVVFDVVTHRKKHDRRQRVRAKATKWARVRSSTGEYSERCFVLTRMRLGNIVREIELSLVSRGEMLFRMLIGRKALERDFVVDVSHRQLVGRRARKKKPKTRRSK